MLKNADCTIYENGGTAANMNITGRHYVKGVYWLDVRGQTVTRNGMQVSDSIVVYLYGSDYLPKPGDVIVKGECDFIFDSSSPQDMSASFRQFRTEHPDFVTVKTVNDCRFGRLKHIEITAR